MSNRKTPGKTAVLDGVSRSKPVAADHRQEQDKHDGAQPPVETNTIATEVSAPVPGKKARPWGKPRGGVSVTME